MANLISDLISRAAAIEAFDDERVDRYYGDVSPESVIKVIESIPAVDAVPVVRCRNCKEWRPFNDGKYGACNLLDGVWEPNDFCSEGERMDGE